MFDDDTLVMAVGDSIAQLRVATNRALKMGAKMIANLGLLLVVEKTKTFLFIKKRKYTPPRLVLNGWQLNMGRQMMYFTTPYCTRRT